MVEKWPMLSDPVWIKNSMRLFEILVFEKLLNEKLLITYLTTYDEEEFFLKDGKTLNRKTARLRYIKSKPKLGRKCKSRFEKMNQIFEKIVKVHVLFKRSIVLVFINISLNLFLDGKFDQNFSKDLSWTQAERSLKGKFFGTFLSFKELDLEIFHS